MITKEKIIGICSIGSGVGQSIITSLNNTDLPIIKIGLGNNDLAFGRYECDDYYNISSYYSEDYIDSIIKACKNKNIQILIPGHDDEAYILSKNIKKLKENSIDVIVSEFELIAACRAKEKLHIEFNKISELFVKSYTYDDLINDNLIDKKIEYPLIAKPKDGYGSKDIYIIKSIDDINKHGSSLIYQEIAIPDKNDKNRIVYEKKLMEGKNTQVSELSIQLVADKYGEVHGCMITKNKLSNGIPIEILPFYSVEIDYAIKKIIPLLKEKGLRGPINIQGRLTDKGFKIFEINPRFTGITGLRSKFGFNEVKSCVEHWITNRAMQPLNYNKNSIGIRQTADKVIAIKNLKSNKKTILITGSTGILGRRLVDILIKNPNNLIITLNRTPSKSKKTHPNKIYLHLGWEDLYNDKFDLGLVDIICHLSSAKPFNSPKEISESLDKTNYLFSKAVSNGVKEIIYTSSQSVYGSNHSIPCSESTASKPESNYALLKYAGELTLRSLSKINKNFKYIILRITTLTTEEETSDNEAISKIIKKLFNEEKIIIEGGNQTFNRLHVDDAAFAIKKVLDLGIKKNNIYNISSKENIKLKELFNLILNKFKELEPTKKRNIEFLKSERTLTTINSEKFRIDYAWNNIFTIEDIVNKTLLSNKKTRKN